MTYVSTSGGMTMVLPAGVVVCTSWPGGMMQQAIVFLERKETKKPRLNLNLTARDGDSLFRGRCLRMQK